MNSDFYEMLAYGEEGEKIVASFLMDKGATVLPLYQYKKDRAPYVFSRKKKTIAPDLYVWTFGEKYKDYHAECKRKNRWVHFSGQLETGFDERHFNSYLEVMNSTKKEVYCFFLHEGQEPTGLYCGRLSKLQHTVRIWDGINVRTKKRVSKRMAFFPKKKLRKLCPITSLGMDDARRKERSMFKRGVV